MQKLFGVPPLHLVWPGQDGGARLSQRDPVAAIVFGAVQRLVGRLQQGLTGAAGVGRRVGVGGHANADRKWDVLALPFAGRGLHGLAQVLGQLRRTVQVGAGQQHHEFFTAVAAQHIGRTQALAQQLRALGVGPDVRVAVALPRSLELVIALVAVQRAGGAYLPLDLEHPPERLGDVLRRWVG